MSEAHKAVWWRQEVKRGHRPAGSSRINHYDDLTSNGIHFFITVPSTGAAQAKTDRIYADYASKWATTLDP